MNHDELSLRWLVHYDADEDLMIHPDTLNARWLIVYDYDEHFVKAYDDLLDNLSMVFRRYHYAGDAEIESYFNMAYVLEIMVDKLQESCALEENATDNLYDDFEEALASDILQELANFFNMDLYPIGLKETVDALPTDAYLVEAVFDPDSGVWYAFDLLEDEDDDHEPPKRQLLRQ